MSPLISTGISYTISTASSASDCSSKTKSLIVSSDRVVLNSIGLKPMKVILILNSVPFLRFILKYPFSFEIPNPSSTLVSLFTAITLAPIMGNPD